jgi:flagellar protein FlbT
MCWQAPGPFATLRNAQVPHFLLQFTVRSRTPTSSRGRIRRSNPYWHQENKLSLKVELKPGERIIVGSCVITNSDQRTRLTIEGKLPILREKDILTYEQANTTAKLIYLAVQLMYLEGDFGKMRTEYFSLVNAMAVTVPTSIPLLDAINNEILTGNLYKAIKASKKLIQFERDQDENATAGSAGLPTDITGDSSAA